MANTPPFSIADTLAKGKGVGAVKGEKEYLAKQRRMKALRQEASRKAAIANKRIKRIENNDLKDSPAYQRYLKDGGGKFGVRGKTHNEVQSELARLNRFINAETSTIRGINKNLKDMAKNTKVKYKNLSELRAMSSKFFELSSKVEQYLRNVEDMASAVGYQRIWEAINVYTSEQKINLAEGEDKVDEMIGAISKVLIEQNKKQGPAPSIRWYKIQ